tara:strand:- start:65 stop:916 length:852 start_codon:yes stop_codon:yes gene_type:complete
MNTAFVYLWFDKRDYKFYLGYSQGKKKSYICSSKYMLAEYKKRPNDFKRRILKKGDLNEMITLENKLLNMRKHHFGARYYNQIANFPLGMAEWHKKNPGFFAGENNPNFGNKWSDEMKYKIGSANRGKKWDDERRIEMSKKLKADFANGRVQWNTGIPATEEHKKKNSEANSGIFNHFKGKHHTEEAKKAISEKNKKWHRENPDFHKGRVFSATTRKKMSDARKAYFKNNPGAMRGENHPSFGKKLSKEQQYKMYLGRLKAAKEKWGGEYNGWKRRKPGTLPI